MAYNTGKVRHINDKYKGGRIMSTALELCTKDQLAIAKLKENIEDLITDQRATSFHNLNEDAQQTVMAHLLLALDDPQEWLANCDDADMIMRSFAKYILTRSIDDLSYFLSLLCENAITHFAEHLDEIIQEKSAEHLRSLLNQNRPLTINSILRKAS